MCGFDDVRRGSYCGGDTIRRTKVEVRGEKLKNGKALDEVKGNKIKGGGERVWTGFGGCVIWLLRIVLYRKTGDLL